MSTITPTYLHGDLTGLRASIAGLTDSIPFLLLPVRMETRFMQVDVVVLTGASVSPQLGESLLDLESMIKVPPPTAPAAIINTLNVLVGKFTTTDQNFNVNITMDIEAAQVRANAVNILNGLFAGYLNQVNPQNPTPAQIQQINALMATLQTKMNGLLGKVAATTTVPAHDTSNSQQVLAQLQLLHGAMTAVTQMDTSLQPKQQRLAIYEALELHLASTKTAFHELRRIFRNDVKATTEGVAQIKSLADSIYSLAPPVNAKMDAIWSNYKRAEYQSKYGRLTGAGMERLHNMLELNVYRRLDFAGKLQVASIHELEWQLRRFKFECTWAVNAPVNINNMAKVRVALGPIVQQLGLLADRVMRSHTASIGEIQFLCTNAAAGLQTYRNNLIAWTNPNQQNLQIRDQEVAHLDNAVFPVLQHLDDARLKTVFIRNKELTMAADFQALSNVRLDELLDMAPSLDTPVGRTAFIDKVLENKAWQTNQLPKIRLATDLGKQELLVMIGNLHGVVNQNAAGFGTQNSATLHEALDFLANGIKGIRPDVVTNPHTPNPKVEWKLLFTTETQQQLWVRLYPDDIAVTTHEGMLTTEEISAGKAYWREVLAANGDPDLMLGAWRAVFASYGSYRSAWIVNVMDPKKANPPAIINLFQSGLVPQLGQAAAKVRNAVKQLKQAANAATNSVPLGGLDLDALQVLLGDAATLIAPHVQAYSAFLQRLRNHIGYLKGYLGRLQQYAQSGSVPPAVMTKLNAVFNAYTALVTQFQDLNPVTLHDVWDNLGYTINWPTTLTKAKSWSRAPRCQVMPDRFAVICMSGGTYQRIEVGNAITDLNLQVGFNPEVTDENAFSQDAYGNLTVEPGMKWMVDYEEAVAKGLAVTLTITDEEAEAGYDTVYALGLRATTAAAGRTLVETLFHAHHYEPNGMAFVPVGTPTNNTETGESGWRSAGEDEAISFEVERNSELPPPPPPTGPLNDGLRLAQALGVADTQFDKIYLHDGKGVSNAYTMNTALWPATVGYYMEEMLDTFFTLDNINRTRRFVEKSVSGRGHLPALRVGTNPYGFLVTTAFSKFVVQGAEEGFPTLTEQSFNNPAAIEDTLQVRFEARLFTLLRTLHGEWLNSFKANGKSVADAGVTDPQSHFMEILGLEASALEYYYLYNSNIANRRPSTDEISAALNWSSEDAYGPDAVYAAFKNQFASGYYYTSDDFTDESTTYTDPEEEEAAQQKRIKEQVFDARIFKTRYLDQQSLVTGDQVVPGEATEDAASTDVADYIAALLNANPWDIVADNVLADFPSQSLLGTLLRYSLLLAYRDGALNILQYEGLIDERLRKLMGQSGYYAAYNTLTEEYGNTTRFTYLLRDLEDLDGQYGNTFSSANSFYTYVKTHPMNWYLDPSQPTHYTNYANHSDHDPSLANLVKVKAAMGALGEMTVPELKRLMAEHIDLATYRLDAWELGFANARLQKQRQANRFGIFVGAYAWVENLRPANDRTEATDIPAGLYNEGEELIYVDSDNQGFIHAPSVGHAVTAAILRAGYNNHPSGDDRGNSLAVNLSTARVRMAMDLLDGVRNGLETGAVLGYQFERGLHERYAHLSVELDAYIYDFREEFPGRVAVDSGNTTGNVVGTVADGLALLEEAELVADAIGALDGENLYETLARGLAVSGPGDWTWLEGIVARGSTEMDCILREIDRMADALDALGDLSIVESVYQVAKGNPTRAAVFMENLAKGKSLPTPEVIKTPRTGTVVNAKATLHFSPIDASDITISDAPTEAVLEGRLVAAGAYPTNWAVDFTPRAFAEPSVNKWLGEYLSDPTKLCCLARYTVAEVEYSHTVTLADLGLQPLDCLLMLAPGLQDGGTEFNKRVAYAVRTANSLAEDVTITLVYTERDAAWGSDVLSLYELEPVLDALKQLVVQSAPATAADFYLETSENTTSEEEVDTLQQDADELRVRLVDAQSRLQSAYDALTTFYATEITEELYTTATYTATQLETLRDCLFGLAAFGIGNCIPNSAIDVSDAVGVDLYAQSLTAYGKAGTRLASAAASLAAADATDATKDTVIASLRQMSVDIFGRGFNVVPHFTLRNGADLATQMTLASTDGLLRAADDDAIDTWGHLVARVRKPMAAIENLGLVGEALGFALDEMQPLQLPFISNSDPALNDHWVALEFPADWKPSEDKLSVAVYNPAVLYTDPTANKCALVLDNWVEIIPGESETTGIGIHYNNPDAKAPQSCLVAVTPQVTGAWSWDNLVYTLADTLELAKIRGVEPDHLQTGLFAQLLPGVAGESTDGEPVTNVMMDYGWITTSTEE